MTSLASLLAILAGDIWAGAVFRSVLVLLPFTLVALLTDASTASPLLLAGGIVAGALAFAVLGVLLPAPATSGHLM